MKATPVTRLIPVLGIAVLVPLLIAAARQTPLAYAEFARDAVFGLFDAPDNATTQLPAGTVQSARVCAKAGAFNHIETGVAPTTTLGETLPAGSCITYDLEPFILRRAKFVRVTAGTGTLTVHAYGD